jgi:signal transduction histidine kinase
MSKFLLLILLFCSLAVYSQTANDKHFELDHLPVAVTGQWKFHPGDNSAWADTAFNDGDWKQVDPTQYRHFVPEIANTDLGWFRLQMRVTSAMRGKVVALVINQHGAAEVYFNGALLRTMGHVSGNYADEQTRRSIAEPLTIQLSDAPMQYVAVRYSFNKANGIMGYGNPIISASFSQPDSAWDYFFFQQVDRYTTRSLVSGFFLLLAILQLAIYFFNRERKINLYLSIYAFLQLFTLMDGVLRPIFPSANWYAFLETVFNISAPSEFVFLLAMTYDFFGYKRGRWFYILAAACVPVIIIQFIADNSRNEYVLSVYNILSYTTIIIVAAKAIRQKKPGAALFFAGIIVSLIFFILFNVGYFVFHQSSLLVSFEVALAFSTPAIILAILLAGEFAHNLASLRQKLTEVERLSTQNLQQEQEKQQILSKQNEMLEQRVTERTEALNKSLNDLKATQAQLIQSEKMASLGELTAGIAHEIQNPLNFVNNFSEVSAELISELKEELNNGDINEAVAIATDVEQNLVKIRHHGKRADGIVKGMLEHSRASTGQKEVTDINKLADEYLRLAYHVLRAKDKSFNAELIIHFDEKLPAVNVIPQDIGRVLLNLFNNAFYAVNQKQKNGDADYKPEISVSTSEENGSIIIKVKDNGGGIPDAIREKIMQPFFTTKPTGEGTGLGLSLSYDIVVKGHGGKLDVETEPGLYTEFKITLPVT